MQSRAANADDLETITALTRGMRHQLAAWSPVYFNPAAGADEGHAGFLEFIVASDDHATRVLTANSAVVGFFTLIDQDRHRWVDDLCLADRALWPEALDAVATVARPPWVSCVSVADIARLNAMAARGMAVVSTYFTRLTADARSAVAPSSVRTTSPTAGALTADPTRSARHSFGPRAFTPDAPGALVVGGTDAGWVVGSPSVTPPIYDPGGPTTVIDQIVGPDRAGLVDAAVHACADRGDAQVVVVCAAADAELRSVLVDAGFVAQVELVGS